MRINQQDVVKKTTEAMVVTIHAHDFVLNAIECLNGHLPFMINVKMAVRGVKKCIKIKSPEFEEEFRFCLVDQQFMDLGFFPVKNGLAMQCTFDEIILHTCNLCDEVLHQYGEWIKQNRGEQDGQVSATG